MSNDSKTNKRKADGIVARMLHPEPSESPIAISYFQTDNYTRDLIRGKKTLVHGLSL